MFGEGSQGGGQPGVGQHGRVDAAGEFSDLIDGSPELAAGLIDGGAGGRVRLLVKLCADDPEAEQHAEETLLRAVVQIALDPPSFRPASRDDSGSRGADLG